MAEEAIILPSEPLLLVDRSWQRKGKLAHTSKSYVGSSRVPDLTVTKPAATTTKSRKRAAGQARVIHPAKRQSRHLRAQFVEYKPTTSSKGNASNANKNAFPGSEPANHPHATNLVGGPFPSHKTARDAHESESTRLARSATRSSVRRSPLSNSTGALYAIIDSEVQGFQSYLGYYPSRLAKSLYPMSKHLNFKYNPLGDFWLPAAVHDEVLLHTILFSSALHLHSASRNPDFEGSRQIMKVILDKLNRRLRDRELSDTTIGAVSCLASCEHMVGNNRQWAVHITGMSEMIRVRGGTASIRRELLTKIYRADIVGSVETLGQPKLPLLSPVGPSLFETLQLETGASQSLQKLLYETGVSTPLEIILVNLSELSQAISEAINTQISFDPLILDEEVVGVQQRLLACIDVATNPVETVLSISALIFLQPVTKSNPFAQPASQVMSDALHKSLESLIKSHHLPPALLIWVQVMGALISDATSERTWYRTKTQEILAAHPGINSWYRLKLQLKDIMWIDEIHDEYGRILWNELW
ncbi:hypothetical protein PV10_08499 [Exophiala mesophila]|uniref:Uncharacterized protein n=1 Tax=Exophiala mesophila TaxID=212818 RepID=A0A0D1XKZ4_EXOME|nr:uncharacterized protein PV10_08499 [Exophiala mesophila]KIV88866.1 hypothetical protein PV10_08499 [Exophiala mesophila]